MAKKLTSNQIWVIQKMQKGEILRLVFGLRGNQFVELNGKRLHKGVFKSLQNIGAIEFDKIEMGGQTKHYYKLTELGRSPI